MPYAPKSYGRLVGLPGFSDKLLADHFTLYHGYVTGTNSLIAALASMAANGMAGTLEHSELTRRFAREFNGMRMHELYFENLAKDPKTFDRSSTVGKKIEESFGTYEKWEKDFKAVDAQRGIGWAVLYADPEAGRLYNCWINEHDAGHLAGASPLVVVDVFEHTYLLDYGLHRAPYLQACLRALDWEKVDTRCGVAMR